MKQTNILSLAIVATATTATASHVHGLDDLIARAMDPAAMDPTKLSVLSVLKTAMPMPTGTATEIVLPTGDIAPQWYKDLPADVMVLLAQMYPMTSTAVVSETELPVESRDLSLIQDSTASQATLTKSLEAASVTLSNSSPNGSVAASTSSVSSNFTSITGETNATASGTGVPTGKPGLELPGKSAGTKETISTGLLSAIAGLSVAASFLLFA